MKVSTKGRYGLRAMVDIAANARGSHVPLVQVAERQGISENYLEQVMALLRKGGFVLSVKGPHGGYRLSRSPRDIGVGDLLRTLEGSISVIERGDAPAAGGGHPADDVVRRVLLDQVWEPIDRSITEVVDPITLADLVEEHQRLNGPREPDFDI